MRRYGVPRIAFVNKCDRAGANPTRVRDQLREKLSLNPVMLQLPIGLERAFEGVIDLVTMKALRFEGDNGEKMVVSEIPEARRADAEAAREEMLDGLSMFSDELTEAILDEKVTEEQIKAAIRQATIQRQTSRMMGSPPIAGAPLLDAVSSYLPDPSEERTRR